MMASKEHMHKRTAPRRGKAVVYPKLAIDTPGDRLEREADAMAERVARMRETDSGSILSGGMARPQSRGMIAGSIQRKCAACEEEEKKKKVMRKGEGRGIEAPLGMASRLDSRRGAGAQLPAETRNFMEHAFSADFSDVRVHTGGEAETMNRGIRARAFTYGSDIYFNGGQYAPESRSGRQLLAHELTHVVQQGGRAGSVIARAPDLSQPQVTAPRIRTNGLTSNEKDQLNQARVRLIGDDERATAIVGILIAEDGRRFELRSGGGQGFSSHVEGKAVKLMTELGIKKATLLVEKEPCQICDRSVFPHGNPEIPNKSSRTGEPIDYQISKINTALSADSELTVVDPDAAGLYAGVRSTTGPNSTPAPPRVRSSSGPSKTVADAHTEEQAKPSIPRVRTPRVVEQESPAAVPVRPPTVRTTPAVVKPPSAVEVEAHPAGVIKPPTVIKSPTVTEATPSRPLTAPVEDVHIEGSLPKGASGSGAATGIMIFQLVLILINLLPDYAEEKAIENSLNEKIQDPTGQARLSALQPEIEKATGDVYYIVKFILHYSGHQSAYAKFGPVVNFKSAELTDISIGTATVQNCTEIDPAGKPSNAKPVYGGGWYWDAKRTCTTSVKINRPSTRTTLDKQEKNK
jgi:hypothetical protein